MPRATTQPKATTEPAIPAWMAHLAESLVDGTLVRLVLSSPVKAGADQPLRMLGRLIEVRGQPLLSLVTRWPANDQTQNHELADAAGVVAPLLGAVFRSALLETTRRDWLLHVPAEGPARLKGHRPKTRQTPSRDHDRARVSWLDESAAGWLQALGITDASGRPWPALADKHRQIDRYLEILLHLVRDAGWPTDRRLQVVDAGCGKGHLTFGAWHLLRRLGLQASVLGVELRPALVAQANQVARAIGAEDLEFRAGSIDTLPLPRADVLIALHACNTATDDAMLRGIEAQAQLIVLAPCCHQELRPQMGDPEILAGILRHGIMRERLAEWLTDGLRALYLEWAGYETRLIEFVSAEHTAKNLLLAAVRRSPAFSRPEVRDRILALKAHFGLGVLRLDPLLERPAGA